MYELPMSLGLMSNLNAEGTALLSGLTGFATVWMVIAVLLYLVIVPIAERMQRAADVVTDDVNADQPQDVVLRQAA